MKDKDEVSNLLSKLTLKNDLDQDEEDEEVVESVCVVDKNEVDEEAEYSSKGPVR